MVNKILNKKKKLILCIISCSIIITSLFEVNVKCIDEQDPDYINYVADYFVLNLEDQFIRGTDKDGKLNSLTLKINYYNNNSCVFEIFIKNIRNNETIYSNRSENITVSDDLETMFYNNTSMANIFYKNYSSIDESLSIISQNLTQVYNGNIHKEMRNDHFNQRIYKTFVIDGNVQTYPTSLHYDYEKNHLIAILGIIVHPICDQFNISFYDLILYYESSSFNIEFDEVEQEPNIFIFDPITLIYILSIGSPTLIVFFVFYKIEKNNNKQINNDKRIKSKNKKAKIKKHKNKDYL